jgi:GH24 family phage-related lysozyme (muramidase)
MADTEHLHPIFRARLEGLLAATGCVVRSGWRSSEEQAELYRCYLTGLCNNGNPANPPGSSNHEAAPFGEPAGVAADLEGDLPAAHALAPSFGIHFPIANVEPWHAQPVEVPYAYFTGMPAGWGPAGGSRYTVRRGARGQAVVECQQRLDVHGFTTTVDGVFGPVTETTVTRFQLAGGLDADGIVGVATWAALDHEPAAPATPPAPAAGAGRASPADLRLSSQGAALIASFEGVMLRLYNDPVGHCSVGIGHLVHLGPIDGRPEEAPFAGELTEDFVYRLFLESDAPRFAQVVRDAVGVPLYQSEFDALVSFVYNVGPGGLDAHDSTLARLLNAGDYTGAAGQFARWAHADGQLMPGLVRRREAEAALFRSEWASTPPPPAPAPAPSFPAFPGRLMGEGDEGPDVATFQAQMLARGWTSVAADGKFGPLTAEAVERFQAEKGLVVDGLVGPVTWQCLWRCPVT